MGVSQTQMAVTAVPAVSSVSRIESRRVWLALDLEESWAYRELLYFLVWRDIMVLRCKQAVIGTAWAVLQTMMTILI
jgi:lipopolysaccharide transport system permease protein